MEKRKTTKYATMAEVQEILKHLSRQDERLSNQDRMLDEISKLLKGSVNLNLQGILPMVNEMKASVGQVISDVAHLQRWKKREQESKGTFTIRTSVLITRVLAVIGGIGVVIGGIVGVLQGIQAYKEIQKQNTEVVLPKDQPNK